MPITIPTGLPAEEILENEKIFAIDDSSASVQDIRPLRLVILNLMPKKIETETQILRLISKSPLQVTIDFMKVKSHESKNTSQDHLLNFYTNFETLKSNYYDGMIITGAPVEHLEFEDVDYYFELKQIMEWSKTHVYSTAHICWGAQAGLYYHYGINKTQLNKKLFGIYKFNLVDEYDFLTNGFDEVHYCPQSRHTAIDESRISQIEELAVLSNSCECGPNIIITKDYRQIFILGHFEYDRDTLKTEYFRDIKEGKEIDIPFNYFPNDDINKEPIMLWRSHANLLFRNWLNYIYQMTPYEITNIAKIDVPIGTSMKKNNGKFSPFKK